MAISPITYPPVSEGSLPKPQVGTTDEAQKLKQQEINDVQKPQSGVIPDHKRFDTYEKSDEKLPASESGIYHLPKEEPETTRYTTNTDKVDNEIKKLKEERKQILQELRKAGGDTEKQVDLQKRLSQLDAELQAKDNDAYRKQHATHTTEEAK